MGLGVSESPVTEWVRGRWLRRIQPRVVALAGAPITRELQLHAALLAAGPNAAVSHRAAALLWGMVDDAPIEIVVPRGETPDLRGVIVHQTRDPIVTRLRYGHRVTSPARTLVDLGAVLNRFEVEDALDKAMAVRLLSVAGVEWALADVARPGRRGCGVLRRVLDQRALEDKAPDGLLEPRFARLRRTYGLPAAEFQWPVTFRGRPYYIDFAYPHLMIAIEVDGYGKRATRAAFENDTVRQTVLALLGWTVLRFSWRRVVRNPSGVARDVLQSIANATAKTNA